MKHVFIINPTAGKTDSRQKIYDMAEALRTKHDLDVQCILTKKQGHATEIAQRLCDSGEELRFYACGGDGTVHEIANGLAGKQSPMMIIPLGTGNDFAKKIYGTKKINVENVIKAFGFYNGKPRYDVKPIDLIDYNGEKCINVMSFGLDTKVETIGRKIAGRIPFLGHKAYDIAVVPVLLQPLHYNISFDITCVNKDTGEEYRMTEKDKDYVLFAICNASYYGGGFCPAPNSVLDDGLLNFVLVDGLSLPRALPLIPKYSNGTASEQTCGEIYHTGYIKSGKIWMENGLPLPGNCDGENFDYNELYFKVEPKSLNLCYINY